MRWPKACLGDVAQVVSGATPKSSVDHYWDGDIPWITPADLSRLEHKEVSATARRITEAGLASCSARLLPPKSVLFSSRAPIGHVAINTVPMATNQGFKSFVPDQEILSSDFLYWWLKSNKAYLQSLGRGATFKEVSKEIVESIVIPLPPLEEQRRIAAILDKASNLKDMTRGLNGKFELLLRSIFLRLFGNPVTNEMGWKSGSVGELFDLMNGRAFKTSEWSATGLPIIRIANVRRPSEPYNFFNGTWDQKHLVQDGDILLCWAGQLVSIGVHRWSRGEGLLNQHIFKVVPKVNCDPDFIAYSLGMVIERAKSNFRGIEMKHLTKEDLDREGMIIPPLVLQEKFGDIARSIERLRENCQSQLRLSEELAASIAAGSFEHLLPSQLVK